MCMRWRGRERQGRGGKLYAHGNLVPLRRKGGLGEVCFLLDLKNVSLSPFPTPFLSILLSFFVFPSLFERTSIIFVRTRVNSTKALALVRKFNVDGAAAASDTGMRMSAEDCHVVHLRVHMYEYDWMLLVSCLPINWCIH